MRVVIDRRYWPSVSEVSCGAMKDLAATAARSCAQRVHIAHLLASLDGGKPARVSFAVGASYKGEAIWATMTPQEDAVILHTAPGRLVGMEVDGITPVYPPMLPVAVVYL